jgi:hypothetical protein
MAKNVSLITVFALSSPTLLYQFPPPCISISRAYCLLGEHGRDMILAAYSEFLLQRANVLMT